MCAAFAIEEVAKAEGGEAGGELVLVRTVEVDTEERESEGDEGGLSVEGRPSSCEGRDKRGGLYAGSYLSVEISIDYRATRRVRY